MLLNTLKCITRKVKMISGGFVRALLPMLLALVLIKWVDHLIFLTVFYARLRKITYDWNRYAMPMISLTKHLLSSQFIPIITLVIFYMAVQTARNLKPIRKHLMLVTHRNTTA